MRSLLIVTCLASSGCYTISNGPTARADAHRLGTIEVVAGSVLLILGAAAERNYDSNPDAVPPENVGPLILITGGILTGIAGLISWGNT